MLPLVGMEGMIRRIPFYPQGDAAFEQFTFLRLDVGGGIVIHVRDIRIFKGVENIQPAVVPKRIRRFGASCPSHPS